MADWAETVRQDVRNARNGVPRMLAEEILRPQIIEYASAKTIQIVTPDYPTWLNRADHSRSTALKDSIMDFRRRRNIYNEQVGKLLKAIDFWDAGSALITFIASSGHDLFIRPWTVFGTQGKVGATARTIDMTNGKTNTEEKILAATSVGMPNKAQGQSGSGLGTGSDIALEFSADIFGTPEAKALYSGPGGQTDEILFHEMVHAARLMTGTFYLMPVSQGYDNEEEYLSIVLTNVLISEKGGTDFRARHQIPNTKLLQPDKFLDNVQGVDLSPIVMIERFRLNNPKLYKAFADISDISAPFNPIREFNARRKAGKIRF